MRFWSKLRKAVDKALNEGKTMVERRTKVVVSKTEKGVDIYGEIGQRCPICKMRIRGINHISGMHHRGIVPKHSR